MVRSDPFAGWETVDSGDGWSICRCPQTWTEGWDYMVFCDGSLFRRVFYTEADAREAVAGWRDDLAAWRAGREA